MHNKNDMTETQCIELIRGTFTAEEAKELLLNLIKYKINFHGHRSFSAEVRFGAPEINAQKRINELKQSIIAFTQLQEQALAQKAQLKIEANVYVSLIPKEPAP